MKKNKKDTFIKNCNTQKNYYIHEIKHEDYI